MDIKPETYLELSRHPNIVATKEASGNIAAIARTASLCGEDFAIYSGNDNEIIPIMSLGGKGVISVLANICPRETHMMTKLFLDGKLSEAAKLQLDYVGLVEALFADVSPMPVKAALRMMGRDAGPCRMPLIGISDSHKELLRSEMKAKGLV
jgi:4-hydroxy-tetrahydrodipicolinate synthase